MPDVSRDPDAASVINQGEVLTVYNLNREKLGVYTSQQRDKTISDLQSTYHGFDLAMTARVVGGSTIFGSWTVERNVSNFCANDDNPNGIAIADRYTGHTVGAGGRLRSRSIRCSLAAGVQDGWYVPVRWGVDVGAVLQSYAGSERTITWEPAAALFPGGRTRTETLALNEPGSLYYPRYNQLDFNVKKTFRAGRKTFSGQVDWFNLLNGNAVFS